MCNRVSCDVKGQRCKCWLFTLFALVAVSFLAVCWFGYYYSSKPNSTAHMTDLVIKGIRNELAIPDSFNLVYVSAPDSAFGVYCFEQEELDEIADQAIDLSMNKNMTAEQAALFNPVLDKAFKTLMSATDVKGNFSGWMIKACYSYATEKGERYAFTRWTFLNERGDKILGYLELPGEVFPLVVEQL